ncbi:hypothetical protein BvCmsC97A_00885 [Escherichia coli]|nr:hypothetical protein BvCmsC97A_00885 [Escherichia coli]
MSVTESKAKTERKSSRKPAKTQETVLSACYRIWLFMPCQVTVTVSPQVVADWQHSTCWQSVTSFRLTGLSV